MDASEYADKCFGTADMTIITNSTVQVIDLKLGRGVPVYSEENAQLMIYGLGILSMAERLYDIETVKLTMFSQDLIILALGKLVLLN